MSDKDTVSRKWTETSYQDDRISVKSYDVTQEGNTFRRTIVEHANREIVVVVPVLHMGDFGYGPVENQLLTVKQYRAGTDKFELEFPAGYVDEGELAHEAALRELQEEVGYAANTLIKLGEGPVSAGWTNEYAHIFVALDLIPSKLPKDEHEYMTTHAYSVEELSSKMWGGCMASQLALLLTVTYIRSRVDEAALAVLKGDL